MQGFSLNIRGRLLQFDRPAVMGIINATTDSFYSASRAADTSDVSRRAGQMIAEGADILDIGAYSTRPGCSDVSPEDEVRRLCAAVEAVRAVSADIPLSVDTFRADVAQKAIEAGADIVNDISCAADPSMIPLMSRIKAPYILMHMRGTPQTMQQYCRYSHCTSEVLRELTEKIARLELAGVCDIIVDPGFGFSKTIEQNYQMLRELPAFASLHRPVLVGISRKSMITKPLDITPADALNGTTALHMAALMGGASILRVHDVRAARETVTLYTMLSNI